MHEPTKETYSYKGWIISDSFIKRSLAATGYHMVGGLIIYLAFLVGVLFFGGLLLAIVKLFSLI